MEKFDKEVLNDLVHYMSQNPHFAAYCADIVVNENCVSTQKTPSAEQIKPQKNYIIDTKKRKKIW